MSFSLASCGAVETVIAATEADPRLKIDSSFDILLLLGFVCVRYVHQNSVMYI